MLHRNMNKLKTLIMIVATIGLIVGMDNTLSVGYEDTALLYIDEKKVNIENDTDVEHNAVNQVDNSNILSIDNGSFDTTSGYSINILLLNESIIKAKTVSEIILTKDILSEDILSEAIAPIVTDEVIVHDMAVNIDIIPEKEIETYIYVLTGGSIGSEPSVLTGGSIGSEPSVLTGGSIGSDPSVLTGGAIGQTPVVLPGETIGQAPSVVTGGAIDSSLQEEEELQKKLEEELQKKLEEEELQKKKEAEKLKMDLEAPFIIINNNQMQDTNLYIPYRVPVNIVESGFNMSGIADIYYTINGGDMIRPFLTHTENTIIEETQSSIFSSGSFEIMLNSAGEYTISVTALDQKGNKRTADYQIKLEEDNPIISMVMPTTFDIIIDPYEVAGKGRIYSSTVKIVNLSNRDIKLLIKTSELTVKRDQNEASKECYLNLVEVDINESGAYNNINHIIAPTKVVSIREGNNQVNDELYLSKASYTGDNVLQGYDDGSVYAFQITGTISENSEDEWASGDIQMSVVYEFEVMPKN